MQYKHISLFTNRMPSGTRLESQAFPPLVAHPEEASIVPSKTISPFRVKFNPLFRATVPSLNVVAPRLSRVLVQSSSSDLKRLEVVAAVQLGRVREAKEFSKRIR